MSKQSLAQLANNFKKSVVKHSPEILTGIGIAGMIGTTILAVKATPKALECIEAEKRRQNRKLLDEAIDKGLDDCEQIDHLKPVEVIKACWKCYIPAAVTCVTSATCLIGASSVHLRRNAALATAYKLSETAIAEYRDKVVETIGDKKEQHIREKVAEEQVKKSPVVENDVIVTGKGDTRFLDTMSGRRFWSTVETIKKAENVLNKRMIHEITGYASLNEFYDEIGLPRTDVGDILGWNTTHTIDMGVDAVVDDDGKPTIVLDYIVRPDYEYDTGF